MSADTKAWQFPVPLKVCPKAPRDVESMALLAEGLHVCPYCGESTEGHKLVEGTGPRP